MAMQQTVRGNRHMIVAGHYLATEAGHAVLEAGGNAFDAGVAAGIALGVVQSDIVNVAGVAPIILYHAATDTVETVSGLGWWPKAATLDLFVTQHGGRIPEGVLRTVVPAAPDAWILTLERYGTMSFGEVAAAAIRYAREGYALHDLMAETLAKHRADYERWPSSRAVYLPGGEPPAAGDLFVQADLAASLQYMADQEAAAAKAGRAAGLKAARDAFYLGDIAQAILAYHRDNGGLLTSDDMAGYRSVIEPPAMRRFRDMTLYTCGTWCQGPVLHQMLALVEGFDLAGMGHNSRAYLHVLAEAMTLAFADREAYYGDPRFVEVPLERLLSDANTAARRGLIRVDAALESPAPPSDIGLPVSAAQSMRTEMPFGRGALDTSYVCAVDAAGNVFSATPSDVSATTPVIPGTGLCPSSRGAQSWAVPGHPSAVAPGKRPRLTPSPALAIRDDGSKLPFGTPGGDVQAQAMLQALLNMSVFGMDPQTAVEAPRVAIYGFPDSFEPHAASSPPLAAEPASIVGLDDSLGMPGRTLTCAKERDWKMGAVCVIDADARTGILTAGADPRRPCRAMGA